MKDSFHIGLICQGCGARPGTEEANPFRCPDWKPGDDIDHVLRRELDARDADFDWRQIFLDDEPNPFVRNRQLLFSYRHAVTKGLTDADFVSIVRSVDQAIADTAGVGFRETPFAPAHDLNSALERPSGSLWIKNETGNVSGSHKARHLMGIMLWMEVAKRTGLASVDPARLAIASCGNAALGAAVVARAANQNLDVFIPTDANASVVSQLEELGATLTICERVDGVAGDPCVHRFHEAVASGALPFTVQGNENGLAIDGGLTLGWEIVSELVRPGRTIDRLFIQVGGGALASSLIQSLREARRLGIIDKLPIVHAVQTEGAYPLWRAWDRVMTMIETGSVPDEETRVPDPKRDSARARAFAENDMQERSRSVLHHAATHRSDFMWPWESTPHSIAHGILDDETYDWLAVVEGMLETGGFPIVVSEQDLIQANELAQSTTSIPVDHTGSAGLAGVLPLLGHRLIGEEESLAVLFTGRDREEKVKSRK